ADPVSPAGVAAEIAWEASDDAMLAVDLDVDMADAPDIGTMVRVDPVTDDTEPVWVTVASMAVLHDGSPSRARLRIGGPALQGLSDAPAPDALAAAFDAEILTLELAAVQGSRPAAQLSDLGLVPEHARYWAGLPDDESLFRSRSAFAPGRVELAF